MNRRPFAITVVLAAGFFASPARAEHDNWAMVYGATVSEWDLEIDDDGHIHGTTVWSDAQRQDPVDGAFNAATGYELHRHTAGLTQVFRVSPQLAGSSAAVVGHGWALFQGSCSQGHCEGPFSVVVRVSPTSPPLAKGWIH